MAAAVSGIPVRASGFEDRDITLSRGGVNMASFFRVFAEHLQKAAVIPSPLPTPKALEPHAVPDHSRETILLQRHERKSVDETKGEMQPDPSLLQNLRSHLGSAAHEVIFALQQFILRPEK